MCAHVGPPLCCKGVGAVGVGYDGGGAGKGEGGAGAVRIAAKVCICSAIGEQVVHGDTVVRGRCARPLRYSRAIAVGNLQRACNRQRRSLCVGIPSGFAQLCNRQQEHRALERAHCVVAVARGVIELCLADRSLDASVQQLKPGVVEPGVHRAAGESVVITAESAFVVAVLPHQKCPACPVKPALVVVLGDIKRHGASGFVQVQDRAGGDGVQGNALRKRYGERCAADEGLSGFAVVACAADQLPPARHGIGRAVNERLVRHVFTSFVLPGNGSIDSWGSFG